VIVGYRIFEKRIHHDGTVVCFVSDEKTKTWVEMRPLQMINLHKSENLENSFFGHKIGLIIRSVLKKIP